MLLFRSPLPLPSPSKEVLAFVLYSTSFSSCFSGGTHCGDLSSFFLSALQGCLVSTWILRYPYPKLHQLLMIVFSPLRFWFDILLSSHLVSFSIERKPFLFLKDPLLISYSAYIIFIYWAGSLKVYLSARVHYVRRGNSSSIFFRFVDFFFPFSFSFFFSMLFTLFYACISSFIYRSA